MHWLVSCYWLLLSYRLLFVAVLHILGRVDGYGLWNRAATKAVEAESAGRRKRKAECIGWRGGDDEEEEEEGRIRSELFAWNPNRNWLTFPPSLFCLEMNCGIAFPLWSHAVNGASICRANIHDFRIHLGRFVTPCVPSDTLQSSKTRATFRRWTQPSSTYFF